jgi:hypothetical protein
MGFPLLCRHPPPTTGNNLPSEVDGLKALEVLSLAQNLLVVVPTPIFALRSLKTINLANNKITVLPKEVCLLKKLNVLNLTGNLITQLPAECAELQTTELILNKNQLSKIPVELGKAPKLKVLRVEENCLHGDGFPAEFLRISPVSLIAMDGNPIVARTFQGLDGYESYAERYTATKRKM